MKTNFKLTVTLLAASVAATYFLYRPSGELAQPPLTPSQKQLQVIGDKCIDFGERAIANDPAIVEFQMMVRLSKKAGVIERCMVDNGYKVNPARRILVSASSIEV